MHVRHGRAAPLGLGDVGFRLPEFDHFLAAREGRDGTADTHVEQRGLRVVAVEDLAEARHESRRPCGSGHRTHGAFSAAQKPRGFGGVDHAPGVDADGPSDLGTGVIRRDARAARGVGQRVAQAGERAGGCWRRVAGHDLSQFLRIQFGANGVALVAQRGNAREVPLQRVSVEPQIQNAEDGSSDGVSRPPLAGSGEDEGG